MLDFYVFFLLSLRSSSDTLRGTTDGKTVHVQVWLSYFVSRNHWILVLMFRDGMVVVMDSLDGRYDLAMFTEYVITPSFSLVFLHYMLSS